MRPTAPSRVLGYARVSSAEQARGSSLRDQQDSIARYAKTRGLKVARFFVEAESAILEKIERREQMRALMAEVKRGDLVLCDKIDRWSRDPEFSYASVRKILAAGAHFYAISDGIDPSTSQGDSAMSFRILFAREEHKRIKERMVGTANLLQDQGYYARGLPPIGYVRPVPKGTRHAAKNVLSIDPKGAATVRKVFALCIGGHSLTAIAERTGVPFDQLGKMLRRRTYLGEVKDSHGEWIRGKHEAIIDEVTFARASAALDARRLGGPRPRGTPARTRDWILRDVAACAECGARMGASYGGTGIEYYRCLRACGARYVPVRLVEAAMGPLVLARLSDLRAELATPPRPSRPALRVVEATEVRRAKLLGQRERHVEMYGMGVTTREAMTARVRAIDAELAKLTATTPAASRLADPEVRADALASVRALEHSWRHADAVSRRALVGHLALSVAVSVGAEPVPTWRNAEDLAGEA